jgi:hypothetical protein
MDLEGCDGDFLNGKGDDCGGEEVLDFENDEDNEGRECLRED